MRSKKGPKKVIRGREKSRRYEKGDGSDYFAKKSKRVRGAYYKGSTPMKNQTKKEA